MFCHECGKENPSSSKFCKYCGTKLLTPEAENESPVQEASVIQETKEDAVDAAQPEATLDTSDTEPEKDSAKKSKIPIVIGAAVAVVVIVVIAVVVALQSTQAPTQQETPQTQESEPAEATQEDAKKEETKSNSYILENSATKELTNADIAGLSDDEICIAQNEIWARHGRKFKNNWLQEHFNNQSWYSGTIEADEFLSKYSPTDLENKNAQFLNSVLSSHGYDLNKAHPNGEQASSNANNSNVATLTQQLKDEGYDTVAQGEVRMHAYQSDGRTYVTYYVRLNDSTDIDGYQATKFKTHSTRTICAAPNSKGTFSNEYDIEKYFANLRGHQVLVGFVNGSRDVQFATGTSCNFENHTQSECDLMNSGSVTYLTKLEVKDLG